MVLASIFFVYFSLETIITNFALLQAELMYDTIREWPRYVKVPFPVAKASPSHIFKHLSAVDNYVISISSHSGVC